MHKFLINQATDEATGWLFHLLHTFSNTSFDIIPLARKELAVLKRDSDK